VIFCIIISDIGSYRNSYFRSGWTLKENQEYGKKGGGKHISKRVLELLKGFFHAGDVHKSE
jgi:hypothetical protein